MVDVQTVKTGTAMVLANPFASMVSLLVTYTLVASRTPFSSVPKWTDSRV